MEAGGASHFNSIYHAISYGCNVLMDMPYWIEMGFGRASNSSVANYAVDVINMVMETGNQYSHSQQLKAIRAK